MSRLRDRRALRAVSGALAVLVLAIVVIVSSGGAASDAPQTGAAGVVPGDALLYVHLSIDPSRPADRSALRLAERFPDFPLLHEALLARLRSIASGSPAGSGALQYSRDLRPWLGKEAAVALLSTSGSRAGSLVVLAVSNRSRARRFLNHLKPLARLRYRSTPILRLHGATETAFVKHYLVIGNDAGVRAAISASARGATLQSSSAYRRASAGESDGRVIDAYASLEGVRSLLVPRGGVIGALGTLLYQPALDGVSVALTPESNGVAIRVHSALDPQLAKLVRAHGGSPTFSPTLPASMPSGATLMLDLTRLDEVAPKLLGAGAAAGISGGVMPLLGRLGAALSAEGVDVKRDILSIFEGETVVALVPTGTGSGRPALMIIARTPNEQRTRSALAALELPLAQLFPPPGSGPGQAPVFNDRQVAGITAHQLSLAAGLEFDYAVFDGKLVIATNLSAIARLLRHPRSLPTDPGYRATLAGHPQRLTSLLFLDFSQLLSLAEQTGLTRSARFHAFRADLEKIRAIGLSSTNGEADSTAELFLQIS